MTQYVEQFVDLVNDEFDWVQHAESFLGPRSHLSLACNEICRDCGADRLLAALDRLSEYGVCQLHTDAIDRLPDQDKGLRKQLLEGIEPAFSALRAAVELFVLAEEGLPALASACERAWPRTRRFPTPTDKGHKEFEDVLGNWTSGGSFGYWIARHLYAAIKRKDGELQPALVGAGVTPVLFADLDGRVGKIGKLTVELFSGAGPLIPDPFSLGLTLLSRGEHGFHEALQRAWWRSGLSAQDLHARWRIEPYQPTDQDALAMPVLHGRSVEAGVCCALWAAYGGIPNRDDDRRTLVELDDHAVVTAMFAGAKENDFETAAAPPNVADAKLEKVKKLPAKLESVKASPIDLVVVREGQEIDKMYDNGKAGLYIERVETIKEAFDRLWDLERYMRGYQQEQIKPFREKYYFAPEEEPEPEMAGADAEQEGQFFSEGGLT